ncbi:uncharacterized protein LOC116128733 isoform X3 [Pistacia vera]|nr:uncharacterized protein LOC116122575 [Pistacia vera]XP_031270346.1 uncharacterized protein LOC116128733 isoform X2 [Pistacia vera]XP_031270347.1 uncharacterized protein LOC116128733 isoform X3 [Pistacia vera]
MASNILKLHIQTFKTSSPSSPVRQTKTHLPSLPFALNHHYHSHISSLPSTLSCKLQVPALSLQSSLSLSTPPTTKEEAILQAKTCLSTTLEKPLNNPKLAGKLKKLKQPRYRIEIPIIDDSPFSLSQLALDVFKDLPVRRKGSSVKILILWPNVALTEAAAKLFESHSLKQVEHVDLSSISNENIRVLSSADVAIFLAAEESQLAVIRTVSDSFYPKPVVIFNPRWAFEEEDDFGDLTGFVGSFDVIYSFMGLEVKGILSKRKGVIFKCVRDGVLSGERWNVLVEEEGELKVVSKFKVRPSIGEVETVLYNLMAINSPITKSAKFLKDLVSNVTGKK